MAQNILKFKTKAELEEKFRVKTIVGKHILTIDEPSELGGYWKRTKSSRTPISIASKLFHNSVLISCNGKKNKDQINRSRG